MMTTELARRDAAPMTIAETMTVAEHLARSGSFKDAADVSKAVAKILYGQALGIAPVQSMIGVAIIEGKPAPSAGLVGALVKRSGRYDYRVVDPDADPLVIEWYERGKLIGTSRFGTDDAKLAALSGKQNYQRWPRAMRFSRALTAGARMYCPDIFLGPVYTPDELDEDIAPDLVLADPVTGEMHPHATIHHPPPAAPTPPATPRHDVASVLDRIDGITDLETLGTARAWVLSQPPSISKNLEVLAALDRARDELVSASAQLDGDMTDAELAEIMGNEADAEREAQALDLELAS